MRGIDGDNLVRARIVRGTSGDAEQILVCHSKTKIFEEGNRGFGRIGKRTTSL